MSSVIDQPIETPKQRRSSLSTPRRPRPSKTSTLLTLPSTTSPLELALRQLSQVLGSRRSHALYWAALRRFLRGCLSKRELDAIIRSILPPQHCHIHNAFIRSLLLLAIQPLPIPANGALLPIYAMVEAVLLGGSADGRFSSAALTISAKKAAKWAARLQIPATPSSPSRVDTSAFMSAMPVRKLSTLIKGEMSKLSVEAQTRLQMLYFQLERENDRKLLSLETVPVRSLKQYVHPPQIPFSVEKDIESNALAVSTKDTATKASQIPLCITERALPSSVSLKNRMRFSALECGLSEGVTDDCVNFMQCALDTFMKNLLHALVSQTKQSSLDLDDRQFVVGVPAALADAPRVVQEPLQPILQNVYHAQRVRQSLKVSDLQFAISLNPSMIGGLVSSWLPFRISTALSPDMDPWYDRDTPDIDVDSHLLYPEETSTNSTILSQVWL